MKVLIFFTLNFHDNYATGEQSLAFFSFCLPEHTVYLQHQKLTIRLISLARRMVGSGGKRETKSTFKKKKMMVVVVVTVIHVHHLWPNSCAAIRDNLTP